MKPSFTLSLREVGQEDVERVGGKAASLGEMLRANVPVPPGYIITTEAFRAGMTGELKQAILAAFDVLEAPLVAVRSSAIAEDSQAASWAGQLESSLNVTRQGLIAAVQKCWASIASDHATAYATKYGVPIEQKAVAVVVQAMVNSDLSGVVFTANPVTGNRDEVLVEAAYGLGELLVQGEITPETIIVTKDGEIVNRRSSRQKEKLIYMDGAHKKVSLALESKVISDNLLGQLVEVATRIEQHYDAPQDIEWATEAGKLYIVQSRPITTLSQPKEQL